jgi:glycosyltransferase involved in cell wall biosynthesis
VEQKRITLIADEMLGYVRTGGLGTATSFLAIALGRMGHEVELLYVGDARRTPIGAEWNRLYAEAGVAVRMLPRHGEAVEPAYFTRTRDVEAELGADPPDVVISQDLVAPAYAALRLRQAGLGFEDTLFIVYCHGTRQWITDVAQKARVLPGALAIGVMEHASIELADVVVSPSAYLLDWMRSQGWQLPERSLVIPYLTRSAATGQPAPRRQGGGEVNRLVFFGRLEERKGLRPFAAGLDALEESLLAKVELEFVGAATKPWPTDRVAALLSDRVRRSLRHVSFETALDQHEAVQRLTRPGTVAVMPSLEDNSPNSLYECLELGIPFVASSAGGGGELVARTDRERVLFEPTAEGVASALRRVLSGANGFEPARFAFDPHAAFGRWAELIETRPATRQGYAAANAEEWHVELGDADSEVDDLAGTLLRAQATSGADVVTCAVRLETGAEHFFLGEPGGLGLVSNAYGTVALIRRSFLAAFERRPVEGDPAWPLLAGLSLAGARIVSIPRVIARQSRLPGDAGRGLSDGLAVAQLFETQLSRPAKSLARLATGLAADRHTPPPPRRRWRRLLRL